MKVYITAYILTKGILEMEDKISENNPEIVATNFGYFYKGCWHKTKEAAVKTAEEIRLKKITSLRKQIEKLEALKFN